MPVIMEPVPTEGSTQAPLPTEGQLGFCGLVQAGRIYLQAAVAHLHIQFK